MQRPNRESREDRKTTSAPRRPGCRHPGESRGAWNDAVLACNTERPFAGDVGWPAGRRSERSGTRSRSAGAGRAGADAHRLDSHDRHRPAEQGRQHHLTRRDPMLSHPHRAEAGTGHPEGGEPDHPGGQPVQRQHGQPLVRVATPGPSWQRGALPSGPTVPGCWPRRTARPGGARVHRLPPSRAQLPGVHARRGAEPAPRLHPGGALPRSRCATGDRGARQPCLQADADGMT